MHRTEKVAGLEVVATFWNLAEAHIARGRLEVEGIETRVVDMHSVRIHWDPTAVQGGIKLVAAPAVASTARELLAEDHSALLDEIPDHVLLAPVAARCPVCRNETGLETQARDAPGLRQALETALVLLSLGTLLRRRRVRSERHCSACGHVWSMLRWA